MKTLEKLVASAAVAGLMVGGAGPAVADGGKHHGHSGKHWDDKVSVLIVKHHKRSGHKNVVDYEVLSVKKAAKYAAEKCDVKEWWTFLDEAKGTEKHNKKWLEVCTYDHDKNKNVKYHVGFKDKDK